MAKSKPTNGHFDTISQANSCFDALSDNVYEFEVRLDRLEDRMNQLMSDVHDTIDELRECIQSYVK